jgi:fructose-1,6-bisphosphatase/inositol monophosphatase family enzyme
MATLHAAADAVRGALDELADWGLAGTRPGQYHSDLAANDAAIRILEDAGMGVLSEETGVHHPDRPLRAVLDPVDGSTNASRRIPWYATSICVLDEEGPRAAIVVNQATNLRFEATRGGGARADGVAIAPSSVTSLGSSIVALNGYPPEHLGWRQYRALGAAALDLCGVAAGILDAYVDCTKGMHGPWDYLGGMLVCHEAGAVTADAFDRDLVAREHGDRRCLLAASTPELLAEVQAARARF